MKILIAKTFGIGNAVCAVPMLKAIRLANPHATIKLMLGTTPDDFGAFEVLRHLVPHLNMEILLDRAPLTVEFDVAVLSIPFDGRWQNGVHFNAKRVIDGRPRPDASTMGFSSWKKHEVEYQMENAIELGYKGKFPTCSFASETELLIDYDGRCLEDSEYNIYVGVGYKKDPAGFWKQKHWGNENFAKLIKMLLDNNPNCVVYSTGDIADMSLSMGPISRMVNDRRYKPTVERLKRSFEVMALCRSYIGNDTGMAHVAASLHKNVVVAFKMENAWTKSHPWCRFQRSLMGCRLDGSAREISPEEMFDNLMELHNENQED